MSDTSLIKGTKWHWRQGLKPVPMHGYRENWWVKMQELYLPVADEVQAQNIIGELTQAGIQAASKRTHSRYDVVPKGSLIVFGGMPYDNATPQEKLNMLKLKFYILSHGGQIKEKSQNALKTFFINLFKKGRQK